jgi:hypothetical protein
MVLGLLTSKFEKDFEMKAQVDKSFSWVMNCVGFPNFTIARSSSVNVPTNWVSGAGSCRGASNQSHFVVNCVSLLFLSMQTQSQRDKIYVSSATRGNVS